MREVASHYDKNEHSGKIEKNRVFYCWECDRHFKMLQVEEKFVKESTDTKQHKAFDALDYVLKELMNKT